MFNVLRTVAIPSKSFCCLMFVCIIGVWRNFIILVFTMLSYKKKTGNQRYHEWKENYNNRNANTNTHIFYTISCVFFSIWDIVCTMSAGLKCGKLQFIASIEIQYASLICVQQRGTKRLQLVEILYEAPKINTTQTSATTKSNRKKNRVNQSLVCRSSLVLQVFWQWAAYQNDEHGYFHDRISQNDALRKWCEPFADFTMDRTLFQYFFFARVDQMV